MTQKLPSTKKPNLQKGQAWFNRTIRKSHYAAGLLIWALALAASTAAMAQTTPLYSKNGGTSPLTSSLFLSSASSYKIQEIYEPNDLTPTPISGNITRLYFRNSVASATGTYTNFKVFLGQTATSAFPGTGGTTFFTGLSQVVNTGTKTLTGSATAGGWFAIDLDIPFAYNNSQTLILEVQFTAYTGGISTWSSASPTAPNHKKIYSSSVTATTGTTHAAYWQDFGMDVVPSSPCTAPPTAGQAVSSVAAICPNTNFRLSLTGSSAGSGLTYQWQSSANGTTGWTNIAGATSSTLNTGQTATTHYRAQVTCSGQTDNSASVLVTSNASPVSGTFTIDKTSPASATNFQTFADAITSITCGGASGPIVFNVAAGSGTYTELLTITAIPGASATNTITINGNGATLRSTASTGTPALKLNGAKFIRVNNLNIEADPAATAGQVVHLTNGAENNIFTGNTLKHSVTATATSHVVYIHTGLNHNNTFQNNTIIGGYYGIYNYGAAASIINNNQFIGNTLRDQYYYGIYSYYTTNTIIEGNNISRPNRTNSGTMYVIYLATSNANARVTKNRIHNLHGAATSTTGTVYGIYTSSPAAVGSENIISNNAIYNMNNTGGSYFALYNTGGNNTYFFHNTVASNPGTNYATLRGVYFGSASTNVKLQNNIISLGSTATTQHAIYLASATIALQSNRNVLFTGGTGNVGYHASARATLTDWQAANNSAYDQNSVNADPQFANVATGDLTPTNVAINNMGMALVPPVTTDITGMTRNANSPDPGAYEFLNNPNDVGITAITSPNSVCGLSAAETITVTLTNFGTNPQSNIPLTYTLNGGTLVTTTFAGPLAPGATVNYSFATTANLQAGGGYTIVACTSLGSDTEASNNCTTKQVTNSSFAGLPSLDFETAATGLATLKQITNTRSLVSEGTAASNGTGTKGLIMEGIDNTGWTPPAGITTPWMINPLHQSAVTMCFNPAGGNPNDPLWLTFDLKQLFKIAAGNTSFRVMVNGNQVGPTYTPPFTGTPIVWRKVNVDLTPYKNLPSIEISLESAVKEGYQNGNGTANLIDNLQVLRINPTLGVKDELLQSQLLVYPNPNNGSFSVQLPQGQAYELMVTDLTGRIITRTTATAGTRHLQLNQPAKGVYVLQVKGEAGTATRKLIVE